MGSSIVETSSSAEVAPSASPNEVKPVSSNQYVPLLVAKIVSKLLWTFGLFGLTLFAIVQMFTTIGNISSDVADALGEDQSTETFEEVQIGTAVGVGVEDSTEAIVDLFAKNDAKATSYWEFRSILSENASFFVEEVGAEIVISSPNELGSDTIVTLTDGVDYCEIALEGELVANCN